MLSVEEIQRLAPTLLEAEIHRIQNIVVESHKQRFTDDDLWERLIQRTDREIEILKRLPLAYNRTFGGNSFHHWDWNKLAVELQASQPVIELIIWHLTKRGDKDISQWVSSHEEFKRMNVLNWQREACND